MTKKTLFDLEEGEAFKWKGETFILLVIRDDGSIAIVKDKLGNEIPFNPYAYIEPIHQ